MKKILRTIMIMAMAAMTFTACEDVPAPYNVFDGNQSGSDIEDSGAAGTGTQENPFNVAAALAKCKETGQTNTEESYYAKGIVISIEEFSSQHGNITLNISDDAKGTNSLKVYRALGPGNKAITNQDLVKVGDEIVVCGQLVNFKGNTPEFTQGCYIVSVNGVGGGSQTGNGTPKGSGTLNDPYNPVAATNVAKALAADAKTSNDVYVKGIISSIESTFTKSGDFGNATFFISEDGKQADEFYIFRTLYLNNQKYTTGTDIKVGDEVIICGKLTNYKGNTPETAEKESYLYSLNGKTGSGTDDTPTYIGSLEQPISVTEALQVANSLADNETTTAYYYIEGMVTELGNTADEIGPNSSKKYKDMNYYITDLLPSNEPAQLYVFRGKYLNKADFTSIEQLKPQDRVVICGKLQKYIDTKNNNAVVLEVKDSYIAKLNDETGEVDNPDNPDNPTPQPGDVGEVSGNTITANFTAWGLANDADLTTLTLVDGTTLTFAQNDGRNMPKYFEVDESARLYALNSMQIKAQKKTITKVVLNCVKSRTGNETIKAEAGNEAATLSKDDTTITVETSGSESVNIINDHTSNSGGTQVRMVSIEITYAE